MKEHSYQVLTRWTGNRGEGTSAYGSYSRNYTVQVQGKPVLKGSADPDFRGDSEKYNPEDMFVASLSACHMLWYLHFCADHGITVISYEDRAEGVMKLQKNGSGKFTSVILNPVISILEKEKMKLAKELHSEASRFCFIANSCNFKIGHRPVIEVVDKG